MSSGKKSIPFIKGGLSSGSEMKMSLSVCVAFKQSFCDGFDAFLRRFAEVIPAGAEILT